MTQLAEPQTDLLRPASEDHPEWYWMVCLPADPLYVAAVPMSISAEVIVRMLNLPALFPPKKQIALTCYMRWRSEEDAIESMAANQRHYGKSYGLAKLTAGQQRYAIDLGRQRRYGLVSNSNGTTGDLTLLGAGSHFSGDA